MAAQNHKKQSLASYIFKFDGALFAFSFLLIAIHYLRLVPANFGPQENWVLFFGGAIGTLPVLLSAWQSFKNRKVSVDLLAAIALVFSLAARQFLSAVFINLMLISARILAAYTDNQARRALEHLAKFRPSIARVKKGDKIIQTPIAKLQKGDLVIVELGETIPVDGKIIQGEADVDQASITGESVPVFKTKGDPVLSSTVVVSGNLNILAEKIGKETTLEKIIELVEKSEADKPEIITLGDKFASWYITLMLVGSAAIYLITGSVDLVLAVILVVCADDIAVAIPLAFVAALGYAAKRGVIAKGGSFIEGLNKTKIIFVDKTGTITFGRLKVEEVIAFEPKKLGELLSFARTAAALSPHPAAKAILHYLKVNRISAALPDKFEEYSGKGAIALHGEKEIIFGKKDFLKERGVRFTGAELAKIEQGKEGGKNVTLIAFNKTPVGFFALADEIRHGVRQIFSDLKKLGVERIIMLTGDNEKIAQDIASRVGIKEVYANLMPEEKVAKIKSHLSKDYTVVMVGDGVNDAASLNAADIGIAMGGIGSDVTIESGDIVLMQDNLSKLPELFRLAKDTAAVANQDFWIWAAVNLVGLALVFAYILSPTRAAAYNFITDFLPILNSMKLFRRG